MGGSEEAGNGGLAETVLHVGLEDTAGDKGFDSSKEEEDPICLVAVCAVDGENDFLGSEEDGSFFC